MMSCAVLMACALVISVPIARADDPPTEAQSEPQVAPATAADDAVALEQRATSASGQTAAEHAALLTEEINQAFAARKAGELRPPTRQQVQVEQLAGGGERARPPFSSLNIAVVTIGADGSFQVECAEGPDKASALLYEPASSGTTQAQEE